MLTGWSELASLSMAPMVGICTLSLPTCSREFSHLNYTICSMVSLYSPSHHGLGYYGRHAFYMNSAIKVATSDPNDLGPWHKATVFYLAQTSPSPLP